MKFPDLLMRIASTFGYVRHPKRNMSQCSLRHERVRLVDIPVASYLVIRKYGWTGFCAKLGALTRESLLRMRRMTSYLISAAGMSMRNEGVPVFVRRSINYLLTGKGSLSRTARRGIAKRDGMRTTTRKNDLGMIPYLGNQPGKIAIVVHAYYVDLFDELVRYLSNIPFQYDLLITVVSKDDEARVNDALGKGIPNCAFSSVRIIPNRGRDISSLAVTFRDEILGYDYLCHVHTKKSLYTKSEQVSWRRHLLDSLLGSERKIMKIFGLFERENVGLIYPETFEKLPYWAHTWLSNRNIGGRLFALLGLSPRLDGYIDYPMGSMFWARVDALRPLFFLRLGYEDFPEENGELRDGTMAHAIERIFCILSRSSGYDYSEINFDENNYTLSCGSRNLFQYSVKSTHDLKRMIDEYDVISFDIFDTLLIRPLLEPDLVYDLLERVIESKYGVKNFKEIRKKRESQLRFGKNFTGDVSLDEIYDGLGSELGVNEATARDIRGEEIAMESRILSPRKDIREMVRYARSVGKRIVFVSDTYYGKEHIDHFLRKNDLLLYDRLYLSNIEAKRKDDGTLWDFVIGEEGPQILHIGDNEHSDVQIPLDKGVAVYHILSLQNFFDNYIFQSGSDSVDVQENLLDGLMAGLVGRRIFADAFLKSPHDGVLLRSFSDFGYVMYGPILLEFFLWLLNEVENVGIKRIFFISRDGYFLKKIYDRIVLNADVVGQFRSFPESEYLLASRRSVVMASIEQQKDIEKLLTYHYKGNLHNLLEKRFGVTPSKDEMDIRLSLPDDFEKANRILRKYVDEILTNAKMERSAAVKYLKSLKIADGDALIDLGYSGTIQRAVDQILSMRTRGFYFATTSKIAGIDHEACFRFDGDNVVHRYSLLLEAFLTSPAGQLLSYGDGTPGGLVFGDPGLSQMHIDELEVIANGAYEFIRDFFTTFGSVREYEIRNCRMPSQLYGFFAENPQLVSNGIREILLVEDHYCGFGEISVFDFYNK